MSNTKVSTTHAKTIRYPTINLINYSWLCYHYSNWAMSIVCILFESKTHHDLTNPKLNKSQLFQHALSTLTPFYIRLISKMIEQNLSYFQLRTKQDLRYLSLHNNVIIIESLVHFIGGVTHLFIVQLTQQIKPHLIQQ